jgi:hypothetical protein
MRRLPSGVCALLLSASSFACGSDSAVSTEGRDSGPPTIGADSAGPSISSEFSSSACKKEFKRESRISSPLAHIRALKVIQDEGGLEGLRCVAWQRLADELKVDLYNFVGACGAVWMGDGTVTSDGTLALDISNPSCTLTACGVCLYDWSFDLRTSVATEASAPVTVAVHPCGTTSSTAESTWTEMIGDKDQGIHCVFADYNAVSLQAGNTGTRGTFGMPCVGAAQTCSEGLICAIGAAANENLCLVPCTTDANCPRTDVWSCQSSLCRPRP